MQIEHTEKCLAARAKEREALAAYEYKWPNFCRRCGGTGEDAWIENQAPAGGCHWGMMMSEPCPHCIGQGKCPRCGVEGQNNFEDCETLKCFACGWDEGMAGAPEVLNDFECGCYEDALEAAQNKERELFRPLEGQY